MAFFILHVISTRDLHISSRAEGPTANMGRGTKTKREFLGKKIPKKKTL